MRFCVTQYHNSLDTEDAEIQTLTEEAAKINQLRQNISEKENELIRLTEVKKGIDSKIQKKTNKKCLCQLIIIKHVIMYLQVVNDPLKSWNYSNKETKTCELYYYTFECHTIQNYCHRSMLNNTLSDMYMMYTLPCHYGDDSAQDIIHFHTVFEI